GSRGQKRRNVGFQGKNGRNPFSGPLLLCRSELTRTCESRRYGVLADDVAERLVETEGCPRFDGWFRNAVHCSPIPKIGRFALANIGRILARRRDLHGWPTPRGSDRGGNPRQQIHWERSWHSAHTPS